MKPMLIKKSKSAAQGATSASLTGALQRSLALFTISIGLFFSSIIYAQDTVQSPNWLETTTNRDSIKIAVHFASIDFEEKTKAIQQIARREDRNFSSLLDMMHYQASDNIAEKEFILYLMLDNFFNDEKSVQASKDSFLVISNNIANYKDSILRKKIMEKTVMLDKKEAEDILLKQALFLLEKGKERREFNREMIEESRIFFIYSQKIDSPVLNFYRHEIYVTVSNLPYSFFDIQENAD